MSAGPYGDSGLNLLTRENIEKLGEDVVRLLLRNEVRRFEARDRFAAAALTGLLASHPQQVHDHTRAAEIAYQHADAMLAVREQQQEPRP